MELMEKPIAELDRAHYNPRVELTPDDPRYQKLKKSILEFGLVEPIIWNRATNRVVGGHQRLNVLTDLGRATVQVSVVDLDETKEKALNLAMNKTGGDWDTDKLTEILSELEVEGYDLEVTGFDQADLDRMLREMEASQAHNGTFLDQLAASPINEDQDDDEARQRYEQDLDDEDEEEQDEILTIKFPVTVEQRETILEAIKLVKTNHDNVTTSEALDYICRRYLQGK